MKSTQLIENIKVIDMTENGGLATLELADNGASVLKIEKIDGGDPIRQSNLMKNGQSLFHSYINRGKKSIGIDIDSEEGKKIFLELVKEADVLVENFMPGVMESKGLGYEKLAEINPRLVYGQLTPFGLQGPFKDVPAPELLVEAQSCIMDITGPAEEAPSWIGFEIGEHYGNLYLAAGIMIALYQRENTGRGQKVDVSKMDALFSITEDKLCTYYIGRINPTRLGNAHPLICPYDVMKTKDGYCALGVSTEAQWEKFCKILKMDEFLQNPNYQSNVVRSKHYFGDLRNKIEAVTMTYGKQELAELLATVGIPSAAISKIEEAMNQEQIKERNMLVDVDCKKAGILKMPNRTIRVGEEDEFTYEPAPEFGEDTKKLLRSLAYTDEQIELLYDKNIVG